MTIRSFEIFLAVCEKMNMSRAAESLFITQAAVSHSITSMEKYYGVTLFERRSSKIYLTPAGEFLRTNAAKILNDLERLKGDINSFRHAKKRIRLGCTLTIGEYFIHDFLDHYYSTHEDVEIFIGSYQANTSNELLMRGELDIILTETPANSGLLDCARIFNDEAFFICHRNSKHLKLPECRDGEIPILDKSQMQGLPIFIQVWDPSALNLPELALRSQGLDLEFMGYLNSFEEVKQAVIHDFGIGVMSAMALTNDPDIVPFKVKGVDSKRSISMAICKNYQLSPELLELMDCIIQYSRILAESHQHISLPSSDDFAF